MMNEAAKKQLQPVSMEQIKTILQQKSQIEFDKMLITDQPVRRCDYVYIRFNYQTIERTLKKINFPVFSTIKESFVQLRAGAEPGVDKAVVPSAALFEGLEKQYNITGALMNLAEVADACQFPFQVAAGDIQPQQARYFFPALTGQQACKTCNGRKYLPCPVEECGGRHKYHCPKCNGKGKTECANCQTTGQLTCTNCKGQREYTCTRCTGTTKIGCVSCGGDGIIKSGNTQESCARCSGRGYNICMECNNGIVRCATCGATGKVTCTNCSGKGHLDCGYCNTTGVIECKTCYADKERYGMVDCPDCRATGFIGNVVYVETLVHEKQHETIVPQGDTLKVNTDRLQPHYNKNGLAAVVYKKLNEAAETRYDEYSSGYADTLERTLALSKTSFPMLTKEAIWYQVVPCVELSYKHIVTGTEHEFAIVDIWDNPEVIVYTEAERLKQSVKNVVKTVGGFFSRLFKTKSYVSKEDKRNEIYLLIYMAKVDNRIAEEEKQYLSESITGFQDFINSERQKLFDLLNATALPELTPAHTTFSTKEKAQDVFNSLTELANADREMVQAEEALLQQLKGMLQLT